MLLRLLKATISKDKHGSNIFFFPNFIHSRKRLTLRTTIWKQQSRPQFFQHNWTNTFKNAVLEVVLSLTVKQCVLLLFLVKSVRQQGEKYAFLFFPPP